MAFTDENMKLLNELLKTPIEDTQFYQGYPDRCKAYAKALKALLVRLDAAEKYIETVPEIGTKKEDLAYEAWRKVAGKE